jgi:4-aminobutyrate--pyruvate transaminase
VTYIPNSIEARDVASLVHMQTNLRKHQQEGPLVITRGDGCRVYDNSGREYIESIAGLWCASLGFASERLAKVAYEQMRSLGYYHLYRHRSSACDCAGGGATQNRAGADGPRAISVFGLGGERHRY